MLFILNIQLLFSSFYVFLKYCVLFEKGRYVAEVGFEPTPGKPLSQNDQVT